MITILNYKKNEKIIVQPCSTRLEQQAHTQAAIEHTPEVWKTDGASISDIVNTLAEMQVDGTIKQTRQGRYVLTSKGLNFEKRQTV
jgi:hypothetical protein